MMPVLRYDNQIAICMIKNMTLLHVLAPLPLQLALTSVFSYFALHNTIYNFHPKTKASVFPFKLLTPLSLALFSGLLLYEKYRDLQCIYASLRKLELFSQCMCATQSQAELILIILSILQNALIPEEHREAVVSHIVKVHELVGDYSLKFLQKLRRNNYVTPKNYLDFINTYLRLLTEKDAFILSQVRIGFAKLSSYPRYFWNRFSKAVKLP